MHVTLVEINVHEDKVDEFIEVFRQNHLGSVISTKPIKMKTQWRSIKPRPTTKPVSRNWNL